MKKIQLSIFALVITSLFFASACGDENEPLFTMETEARFTIPAGLNTIETYFFQLRDVPTFFDVFSSAVNLDSVDINQLIGQNCILNPVGDVIDLDFINDMNIYILDPSDPNIRHEIFFRENIELGSKDNLRLFNSIVDVQEFMKLPDIDMEVEVRFRQITFRTVEYQLDMDFAAFGQR